MKKKNGTPRRLKPPRIVTLHGQRYGQTPYGQMIRVDSVGRPIPRIRMSKKEKLRLREELHRVNEMDSHELANKIVENAVPVVNPKSEEQLKSEQEAVQKNA